VIGCVVLLVHALVAFHRGQFKELYGNGTASVRLSVCLSLPFTRPLQQRATGLHLCAPGTGDIDLSTSRPPHAAAAGLLLWARRFLDE